MVAYLLKSGIILTIFYLFYKLLLEKEPIHIFKRIYLLCGLLLAFTIPLITFTTVVEVEPVEFIPLSFSEIPIGQQTAQEVSTINYWPILLWTIYGFGVLLFGLKFLFNLLQIGNKIRRNTKKKVNQFTHVLLENVLTPHTFFDYIFLNKQRYLQHQIPQEVFWHEETHAKQKHSLDIVLVEILQVVFWFNPLFYFIKKDIKLNHEFLADKAVLNKGVSLTAYQEILLAFSTNSTEPQLANALNYSSIKKRFTIMKTKTSKKAVWIKSLILLPLVAVLVYGFSQTKEKTIIKQNTVPQVENSIEQNVVNQGISDGATDRMMEEYNDFIDTFKKSKIIYGGLYKRAVAIYELMTDKQKASVKKYPTNVPNHRMSETRPRTPSEAEFNSWKDKSKFAIWIDGKNVDNSVLNNYKKTDIVHFSGSFVHKNARSKRFPQTQQYSLYTKKGFEEIYKKADYKKYMRLLEKYNEEVDFFNKTDRTDNSELLILKQQADFLYSNFTKEELKKYNPPKTQKAPRARLKSASNSQENNVPNISLKINKNKEILINGKTSVTLKTLKKAIEGIVKDYTPDQLSKVKAIIEADGSLKMGIIINVKNEIRKAGVRQRKLKLDSNNNNQDKVTPEELAEYNKLAKHYNGMSKNNMIVKVTDINRLSYIYNRMTKKQKQNAEPFPNFPPPPPPVKIGEKVSEGYELPPPTPPAPSQKTIEKGSKKLREAFNNFSKESELYGKAVQKYRTDKKGLDNIENQYKKVMELHKIYEKQATAEGILPAPPPPPPTPPNPTDHMIEMAKKGAIFYYEDKKISSDKAIDITKKNKSIHIQVLGNGSSNPVVKLSKKPITVKE